MKRFMKIVFKVVFSIILLFLCLAFKPHEARAEFFNGGIFADDDEFLDFSEANRCRLKGLQGAYR